ncbi:zinc finger protein 346-like isoform X1 [Pecten maximus]|uniref:zinc finger protein 346-like isoform X1 n=1 Tax=Pecten maximus TaxID=6579 RepID=UPI001459103B|nr:zinc finger protein 346-like isoform X1 [Pecten maximus]
MQHTIGKKHLNKMQPSGNQIFTKEVTERKNESDQDSGGETKADPFRKVIHATNESPRFLPSIDLPPPPPPPTPPTKKRKAEEMNGCDICQVFYNSPSQKEVHLKGKKHQKKLKTTTEISPSDPLGLSTESLMDLGSCELCHVNYSSVTIRDQHLSGAKHRRKVQLSESTHQETEMCTLCNVTYTSPSNKLHHIQGRKHLRNIQSHSTPETAPVKNATCFRCMFCNISVNSLDQLEIHRQGSKHRAILQKMKEQQQGGVVDDRSVVVATQKITN